MKLKERSFRRLNHHGHSMISKEFLDEPARPKTLCNRQVSASVPLPYGALQQIANAETGEGLHVEPGFWLNLPDATLARLSTIPHGNSLLAQGNVIDAIPGPPPIEAIDPTPFTIDLATGNRINENDPKYTDVLTNAAKNPPPGIPGGVYH